MAPPMSDDLYAALIVAVLVAILAAGEIIIEMRRAGHR
jgi:hypothetical protein